ncbi:hypothetical protein [Weissella confusa]|uniref:hypothetical protein n=1 Tax=Weissella confusa TaxID=1583 RepID=UPI0018F1BE2F|nr:hypothetical protein [Weissella confusa]
MNKQEHDKIKKLEEENELLRIKVAYLEKLEALAQEKKKALMSRLWTGFFGTERCRTPKNFQNPDFSLKWRDFWVFL